MVRSSTKGKIQQVVWVDAAAMVPIMQLAKRYNLAPNIVISELLNVAADDEEVIKKLDEKLRPPESKGIIYGCNICHKTFYSINELVKHLYSHIQTKQ